MGDDSELWLIDEPSWPVNSARLEIMAATLNPDGLDGPADYFGANSDEVVYANEIELMACGEASDIEKLIELKHLEELQAFLEAAFDGVLQADFFEQN